MRITITLGDKLATDLRKVAVDRGTTLNALICDHLESLTRRDTSPETKQRELDALERSFKKFHLRLGPRTWRREDLYRRN